MGLAVFLASPASDFINGQVVYIDGGILAYIGQDPSNLDASKFAKHKDKETLKKSPAKKTDAKKTAPKKAATKKAPSKSTAKKSSKK
jgi:hypothetical protein